MAGQNGVVLHTGTYSQLRMDWSSTPNVSTNQSSFTATIYVQVTTSGWNIGPWSDVSGSYFGTSSGHTFNGAIPNISGRYNMKTFNTTVNHASDGKGSINIVWKWGVNSSWGGVVNPSGSRTLTLDTIARATQPNISPASQGVGGVITINTPRASSAFTHTLKYDFAGASGTIATGVATSYKWTVPKSLADRIPNSTSNGMTITCITYNGSSNIGSKTVGATITIPDAAEFKPTITSHKVSEAATLPSEFAGTYVQTKSKLKIEMAAKGAYSSTIKSYEIKANNATYASATATTDLLSGSGAQSIFLKAVDSRNRSVSTSTSVNVAAYVDPSPSALAAVRCNADGAENDEGEYAKLTISASVSPVDNKNKKEFSIKYRPVGGAASYTTVALPSTSYTLSSHQVIIPNIDVDNAYEIILIAKDSFSEFTRSIELPTAFTLMDFKSGGRGIALGQVATEDGLNVNLDTTFKKNTNIVLDSAIGASCNFKHNGTTLATVIGTDNGIKIATAGGGVQTTGTWGTIRRDLLYNGTLNAASNSIQTANLTMPSDISNVSYYDEIQVLFLDRDISGKEGRKIVNIWSFDNYWMASEKNAIDINISTGNWIGLRCQYSIPSGKHSSVYKIYGIKYPIQNVATLD